MESSSYVWRRGVSFLLLGSGESNWQTTGRHREAIITHGGWLRRKLVERNHCKNSSTGDVDPPYDTFDVANIWTLIGVSGCTIGRIQKQRNKEKTKHYLITYRSSLPRMGPQVKIQILWAHPQEVPLVHKTHWELLGKAMIGHPLTAEKWHNYL